MGYIVDHTGVATAGLGAGLIGIVVAIPQYWLIRWQPRSPVVLMSMGVGVSALLIGINDAVFLWLADLFPTEVRGRAVCFYYNLGAMVGGFAPMICEWLLSRGCPLAPGYYTFVACVVSTAAMCFSLNMHQNGGKPLQVGHIIDDPY
mmetsp:Transcript_141050/g.245858  ORF Transcript_141050/g.245858 Transcript_141050/m.245858 type:complete len:147 (-) Transcript_141050:291-731(-)